MYPHLLVQGGPPPFTSDGPVIDRSLTNTKIRSRFPKNEIRIGWCFFEVGLANLLTTSGPSFNLLILPHQSGEGSVDHSQGRKHQGVGFVQIKSWFSTDIYYNRFLATQLLTVALHTLALSYSGPNPSSDG